MFVGRIGATSVRKSVNIPANGHRIACANRELSILSNIVVEDSLHEEASYLDSVRKMAS